MNTGVVKWFDNRKGYGFILADEAEGDTRDIFVHYTKINMDGFKKLETGDAVSFSRFIDDGGRPQAEEVSLVEGVTDENPA